MNIVAHSFPKSKRDFRKLDEVFDTIYTERKQEEKTWICLTI